MRRLQASEVAATADWIASVQLPSGMIPWVPGGHADVWNHTEAAMALIRAGRWAEAERAFEWALSTQNADGTWCYYHLAEGIEDPRRDPNVGAYLATGAWWHFVHARDRGFLESVWPAVEGAIRFVLRVQQAGGEIRWSMDPDGYVGRFALLTGTSSIVHSLRCAVAIAEELGHERPEWELAAARAAYAVAHRPDAFAPKGAWAMDWYYPVLAGAVRGAAGRERIESRWDEFVMDVGDGQAVRCILHNPWVTAAETAECVMALDALGMRDRAETLLGGTRHLRAEDGAYWTGCVHPQCVRYPGGERSTYSAAAVLLADYALYGEGRGAGLFRGETLPPVMELPALESSSEPR